MPFFGLEPSIVQIKEQLHKLLIQNQNIFSYSTVSIIEIKWQLVKLEKKGFNRQILEKKFSQAINTLSHDTRFVKIDFVDSRINETSYELQKLGHKDYFDTVIASSALWYSDVFITEDILLKKVITTLFNEDKWSQLNVIEVLSWKEFLKSDYFL